MNTNDLRNRPARDVQLIVGEGETAHCYSVKESLLLKSSPMFLKTLTGGYEESESGTIRLPDDKPEVIKMYVDFLKSRSVKPIASRYAKFPVCEGPESLVQLEFIAEWAFCSNTDAFRITESDLTLMEAFKFADRILDDAFADSILFELADAEEITWFSDEAINYIYEHFEPNAEIRGVLKPIWLTSCLHVYDRLQSIVFERDTVDDLLEEFIGLLSSIGYSNEFLGDFRPAIDKATKGHHSGFMPKRAFPLSLEQRRRAPMHRGLIDTGDVEIA